MHEQFHFFDQSALVHRLSYGLKKRTQEVVFLVGAGLSAPVTLGGLGVMGAEGLIQLIRAEFVEDQRQLLEFDKATGVKGEKRYQAAFLFLQGRLGQPTANEVVRKAVLAARLPQSGLPGSGSALHSAKDEELRLLEFDGKWALNPGMATIGKLVTHFPGLFGRVLLTTNFDPLVEIAIRNAGGELFRTFLHSDGNISQTEGPGCHVIHLHGYWYGSDTLHTSRQLQQPRPHLKASLASLLRDKLIVVSGYGGWDDVFMDALMEVVRDDSASPEILWTFHGEEPTIGESLARRIGPGADRGRVSLYSNVDCNLFFPSLYEAWHILEPEAPLAKTGPTNPVRVLPSLREELQKSALGGKILEGDDEDRPPLVEFCIGRDIELRRLKESDAKVAFITGIGGEGKSTLAAQYFADSRVGHCYSYFIWRDCKEESERFENQLASVVETLSGGKISGQDLAKQDAQSIVQLLMNLMESNDVLFVFDNADHYVNLDTLRMTASPDLLIQALVSSHSKSRIILTCRPSVEYPHSSSLSIHLEGLSLDSARRLFSERGAVCGDHEIVDAHQLTNGHAFWLDLLSIQVTKQPSITLGKLIDRIRSEKGELPEKTLNSLWATLKDRERLVLRTLAETVRPETDLEIAEYLQKQLTYQKVIKALNSLRAMNLVVVKRRPAAVDVLELHPLVRQFIRQSFSRRERTTFIEVIISAYRRFMGNHKSELSERPSLTTLQYWTQMAELDIAAGRIEEAFFILNEAAIAFGASGYSREFTRTVRLLLASIDWIVEYANYKAFDDVFNAHVETLGYLGEFAEVDKLLENYELTVAEKDTRYILYCDMKCSSKWNRGEFAEAVKWGEKGQKFKMSSHVDTGYEVEHSLALARRDAGQPELALPVFLSGRSLSEVIDPDELDESRGGAHYGNIGRCLHFMGQVDSALVCYQKSALLTEKTSGEQRVLNQGFIRRWIGELMVARGQFRLAAIFFEASRLKWEQVSPPRAAQIIAMQRQLKDQLPQSLDISEDDIERIFRDWILGRYLDA